MLELIFVSLGLSCVAGALSLVAGKTPFYWKRPFLRGLHIPGCEHQHMCHLLP